MSQNKKTTVKPTPYNLAMRHKRSLPQKLTQGFTLLEVVIAMALGAVGIIAFGGLQLKSYEVVEEARYRSAATFIAAEMAQRMSSNAQDTNAQSAYRDITNRVFWNTAPIDNGPYNISNFCMLAPCSAMEMAAGDIATMKSVARATLPNGNVDHQLCGTANVYDCIIVAWNDAANDMTVCNNASDRSVLQDCYILQIKIW